MFINQTEFSFSDNTFFNKLTYYGSSLAAFCCSTLMRSGIKSFDNLKKQIDIVTVIPFTSFVGDDIKENRLFDKTSTRCADKTEMDFHKDETKTCVAQGLIHMSKKREYILLLKMFYDEHVDYQINGLTSKTIVTSVIFESVPYYSMSSCVR